MNFKNMFTKFVTVCIVLTIGDTVINEVIKTSPELQTIHRRQQLLLYGTVLLTLILVYLFYIL